MEVLSSRDDKLTSEQMREAEAGLIRMLRAKRFPREWIERQVPDVMAQAYSDLAVRIAAGREDETVNLLVVIAYRRALKVLTKQLAHPPTASIENVFHLADESGPSPEREVIEDDRRARLVGAMRHLPARDRKLLALVYFGEMSVRQAGRRLGWGKSAADRHHQAALGRLRALVGDPTMLGAETAVPALLLARDDSLPRAALTWMEGAAETVREAATLGGGRLVFATETGNAAAMSGAGRAASGLCGAALVACLAGAASGVVGPGVGVISIRGGHPAETPAVRLAEVPRSAVSEPVPILGWGGARSTGNRKGALEGIDQNAHEAAQKVARSHPHAEEDERAAPPQRAAAKQTASEFGIEGASGSSPEPEEPTVPATQPSGGIREATPPTPRDSSVSSAASQVHSEFGF